MEGHWIQNYLKFNLQKCRIDIMSDDSHLLVRFKLKGDDKYVTISMTEFQYINFLEIPALEECKIIGSTKKKLSAIEKKQLNERIRKAVGDEIDEKYLLQ